MTEKEKKLLLRYIELRLQYEKETILGEFQTSTKNRSVSRPEVVQARLDFLRMPKTKKSESSPEESFQQWENPAQRSE